MAQHNDGIIFVNNNCIGCTKCISNCSIISANISTFENGIARVKIDSDKCNHCGKCIRLCTHNAREYKDDIDDFINALFNNEEISIIVSPSFYILYGEKAYNILGYLKTLGIKKIYDAAFGAEIAVWATANYIKQHQDEPDRAFISSTCPALVNFIELYFPKLLDKIIPVQSPEICTAIYARKHLGEKGKIALLSPCIAKKDDNDDPNSHNQIQFNVTFAHLMNHFRYVDFSQYHAESDLKTNGLGNIISAADGFREAVSYFFPQGCSFVSYAGFSQDMFKKLSFADTPEYSNCKPLLAEVIGCLNGCQEGPCVEDSMFGIPAVYERQALLRKKCYENFSTSDDYNLNFKKLNEQHKNLSLEDYNRTFTDRYIPPADIPQSTYDAIFNSMLKDTPVKRTINCGTCGYKTCKDMASAIAYNYNQKENCIHYMQEHMNEIYKTDHLTGLLNLPVFMEKTAWRIHTNPDKQYILCMCDINNFKIVNNLYGHMAGDTVLLTITKSLKEIIAEDDALIARPGGGFFAFCTEYKIEFLDRLRKCKHFNCEYNGENILVTMRFGLYIIKDLNEPIQRMVDAATIAMDYSQSAMENTYTIFTEKMRKNLLRSAEITSQFNAAIQNKEFQIMMQPQYYIDTNELAGSEVLCRWIKADGTTITPSEFIPIAEKSKFIRTLDRLVWEKTFEVIKTWLDEEIPIKPVSINLSRYNLQNEDLIPYIEHLISTYNVPAPLIHIEVTESAAMSNTEEIFKRLERLRSMGFKIAMDDFGSGYSSLNTLKDIPIDIVKLDMGFLAESDNPDKGYSILTSVVRMSKSLKLETIAEGVEKEEQLSFLKTIGCDIIQGFLYAKPMPVEEYKKLMQKNDKVTNIKLPESTGELDIDKFHDIYSVENFMFENCMGAALIVKLEGSSISLERCNQKGFEVFKLQSNSLSDIKTIINSFDNTDSKNMLIKAIKENEESKTDESYTLSFSNGLVEPNVIVWLKIHMNVISSDKKSQAVLLSLEDITGEKTSSTALALANNQLKFLLEKSMIGMCLFRVTLDPKNLMKILKIQVLEANQRFIDFTGYSKEELLTWDSKSAMSVFHPLDRPGFVIAITKAFMNKLKDPFEYVYRAKCKNNEYVLTKMMAAGIQETKNSFLFATNYVPYTDDDKDKRK